MKHTGTNSSTMLTKPMPSLSVCQGARESLEAALP